MPDAIQIAETSPENIVELGIDARGVLGGIGIGHLPKTQLATHIQTEVTKFKKSYNRTPVITSFTVLEPGTNQDTAKTTTTSPLTTTAQTRPTAAVDETRPITLPPEIQKPITTHKTQTTTTRAAGQPGSRACKQFPVTFHRTGTAISKTKIRPSPAA